MSLSVRSTAFATSLLVLVALAPTGAAAQTAPPRIVLPLFRCGARAPRPLIRFTGRSPSTTPSLVQYNFTVVNYAAYPNCMFAPSPQLPPCGANTQSSRTWIDVFATPPGGRVYGFCALTSNATLMKLWFARPKAQPPSSFWIVMTDRLLHRSLHSNTVVP